MDPAQLQVHVSATYRALRWGTAALGIALPWVLYVGGRLAGLPLQGSMSAYYHTGMRDELVGGLVAVAALLVLYKGYTQLENWALNLAGAFLVGVALFPMRAACADACRGFSPHGTFAVLFFLSIAYVCVFRASDTLGLIDDEARRARYRRTYRLLGGAMIASPGGALVLAFLLAPASPRRSLIFFVEAAGVYAFAAYWIVKSKEIAETGSEELALQGRLATPVGRARHVFGRVPVACTGPAPRRPGAGTRHGAGRG